MLTRSGSTRTRGVATRAALAALLSLVLTSAGGFLSRPVSAQGSDDVYEQRLPGSDPAWKDRQTGRSRLGNPGSTDADPDEFSVNNVGIRNPDVRIGAVGGRADTGQAAAGRWHHQLPAALLQWLRSWLPLFLGR